MKSILGHAQLNHLNCFFAHLQRKDKGTRKTLHVRSAASAGGRSLQPTIPFRTDGRAHIRPTRQFRLPHTSEIIPGQSRTAAGGQMHLGVPRGEWTRCMRTVVQRGDKGWVKVALTCRSLFWAVGKCYTWPAEFCKMQTSPLPPSRAFNWTQASGGS